MALMHATCTTPNCLVHNKSNMHSYVQVQIRANQLYYAADKFVMDLVIVRLIVRVANS